MNILLLYNRLTGPPLLHPQYVGSILKDVFLIFPQYCLGRGLMDMATEMNINLIVAKVTRWQ